MPSSHHYTNFDASLTWEVTSTATETVISGTFRNVRYALMENIEIWVTLRDTKGMQVARAVDYIFRLDRDDTAPFSVKLAAPASGEASLLFTYKYQGSDGGDGATAWMQAFESDLTTKR
ncbi:FxLYD domain-containing protein [Geobacter sp. SVR]|uniref:FxLYD domain-containing protein n=1 Tax=Geobacter sp. SVR TaxID=2495594 RepID=UPI00143EFE2E|nr:FxLYD domain-containing protein [Geobacter sp. SVR]BCS52266.1 hypothetical protein GSVR_05740 [Geobacter sp. SVR]GCF85073.1 hypothetical protein GSbR_16730 [Geobacter sp. SVR]